MTLKAPVIAWPPPYTLRRSARAKRLSLRLDPKVGLEVVLPIWATELQATRFLQKNRGWVDQHAEWFHERARHQQAKPKAVEYPELLSLRFLNQDYKIQYQPNPRAKRIRLIEQQNLITVVGSFNCFDACVPVLTRWLKRQAQHSLTPLLDELSQLANLPYRKLCFRGQNTIWGSCSKDGDISLNYKLLFFSQACVRYVLIHELCHIRHFDHSSSFWALVGKFEPNYQALKENLRQKEASHLPVWL